MRRFALLAVAACSSPATSPTTPDAPSPTCTDGPSGTQHGLSITSGGETRFYFLHVPDAVHCTDAVPLWIDFHGTAGDPAPEEAYGTDAAIAAADREGVILVRPRSRSSVEAGGNIYRWDENPGDIDRNRAFVRDLVTALQTTYAIDPARVIVSGFSSGANMAAQYLRPDELAVAGIGEVGGGFWDVPQGTLTRIPAHVYTVTGFRDYMVQNFDDLRDLLRAASVTADVWYWRQADTGHQLYAWHFDEMLPWLLRGQRRAAGTLAAGWTDESIATDKAVLDLQLHGTSVLAGGSEGAVWRRAADGTWSALGGLASSHEHVTRLCSDGDTIYAAAQETLYRSNDGGQSFADHLEVPELEETQFGTSFLETIDCAPGRSVLAGGWWTSAESANGATWTAAPMIATYQVEAAIADLARASDGTAVAVGYDGYVGTRAPGGTFAAADLGFATSWFDGVATDGAGHWWIAGDGGSIMMSADNGKTWTAQATGTAEDFYAIAFRDGQTGAAVGAHGTVVMTSDGGAHWQDASLGRDGFLGAALWLDAHTLVVAGEHGTVVRRSVE